MGKKENIKIYKTEAISIADVSNSARYIIIGESTGANYGFEFTVVDTKGGMESYGDHWKRRMCETLEKKEAIEICNALNKYYC